MDGISRSQEDGTQNDRYPAVVLFGTHQEEVQQTTSVVVYGGETPLLFPGETPGFSPARPVPSGGRPDRSRRTANLKETQGSVVKFVVLSGPSDQTDVSSVYRPGVGYQYSHLSSRRKSP